MKLSEAKYTLRRIATIKKNYENSRKKEYDEKRQQFKIIKAMHTIEKGLSLKDVRVGFGVTKALFLMEKIEKYVDDGFDCEHCSIQMAMGAIKKYVEWNGERNALDSNVKAIYERLLSKIVIKEFVGGTLHFSKDQVLDFNAEEFEKLVVSRHSMRHFGEEPVDIENVKQAIKLAQHCPSACNRQPTKVHIISSEKDKGFLTTQLEGVGGFANSCSAFLIITGDVTAFDFNESNQWIVNAGIFTGYLSLTLHSKGIASCVIQRPLVRSKKLIAMREYLRIPDNEEVICAMGIGVYPDEFNVPASTRLPTNEIITEH